MPRLSVHVLADGERVPMLHDARRLPLFYPTLFATVQLRNAGAAVNTIKNKLMDIVVLLRWQNTEKRDLAAEFMQGRFLTVSDIVSLRDFARLDMRKVERGDHSGIGSCLPGRNFLESRTASVKPAMSVSGQQHYNRLSTIADYLEFVASVVTQHKNSSADAVRIAQMAKTIRRHRPRGLARWRDDDSRDKSPPSELIDRFMAVTAVDHPQNPFRDPDVSLRNAVLFGLLRYTGMRRGELLSLRLDQFDLGHEPLVWVRRNQDDVHDPRRYQPSTKTKERPLPLPRELANQVEDYIMNHRAKVGPARKHPYLLVSHQRGVTFGQPLSGSALGSQIMARMRAVDPEFACIHPHAFRHHFNYELSARIDAHNAWVRQHPADPALKPVTEAQELDVRAFINGHRSKASGAAYNQRHIREISDRAMRQVQSGMTGNRNARSKDNDKTRHED